MSSRLPGWVSSLAGGVAFGITLFVHSMPAPAQTIAMGANHTCAISGAAIFCWGKNDAGQIGAMTLAKGSSLPVKVQSPVGFNVTSTPYAITAGLNFTCAIYGTGGKGVGQVACWGGNLGPPLGYPTSVGSTLPRTFGFTVPDVTKSDLVAGTGFVCGRSGTEPYSCRGELIPSSTPLAKDFTYSGWAYGIPTEKMYAGGSFVCLQPAVKNTPAQCAGINNYGQLGTGNNLGGPFLTTSLTMIKEPIVQLALGGEHGCALLDSGSIKCWGRNYNGQLGNGKTEKQSLQPVDVHGIQNAVAITAGANHTCSLLKGGKVKCWGGIATGAGGITGSGIAEGRSTPVEVKGLNGVISVVSSPVANHTCAILQNSYIYCWGSNSYGQLGTDPAKLSSSNVPVKAATFGFNPPPAPSCEGNKIWSWQNYSCVCPYAQWVWDADKKLCSCPPLKNWNATKGICEYLPKMTGAPLVCAGGSKWNAGKGACECPAGQQWNAGKKSCITPFSDYWPKSQHLVVAAHHKLADAATVATSAQRAWKEGLAKTIDADVPDLLAKASQTKNQAGLSKPWLPGKGSAQVPTPDIPVALPKFDSEKFKPPASSVNLAKLKTDYETALKAKQKAFDELHGLLLGLLQTDPGPKFSEVARLAYTDAVVVYMSAFFSMLVKEPLVQQGVTGAADPVADKLLFKYMYNLFKPGKYGESQSALKDLVGRISVLPADLALVTNRALYEAFTLTLPIIKATQPGYAAAIEEEMYARMAPVMFPVVDKTKAMIPAGPLIVLQEQYVKRLNLLPKNVTKTANNVQIEPLGFYLYNPSTKKVEEVKSCTYQVTQQLLGAAGTKFLTSPFVLLLPKTTKGTGQKSGLGVYESQIADVSCSKNTQAWPVWDDKYNCMVFANFANVTVNPPLIGFGKTPYWDAARIGKGDGAGVCDKKKTGALWEKWLWDKRLSVVVGSIGISAAHADTRENHSNRIERIVPSPRPQAVAPLVTPKQPDISDAVCPKEKCYEKDGDLVFISPLGITYKYPNMTREKWIELQHQRVMDMEAREEARKSGADVLKDYLIQEAPLVVRGTPVRRDAALYTVTVTEVLHGKYEKPELKLLVPDNTTIYFKSPQIGKEAVFFLYQQSDDVWGLVDLAEGVR